MISIILGRHNVRVSKFSEFPKYFCATQPKMLQPALQKKNSMCLISAIKAPLIVTYGSMALYF